MKRVLILTATLALAGSLMAQTGAIPPPPPPQQATPAPKAAPATPAVPATPAPAPKPRVKTYRNVTVAGGSYLGVDVRDVTPDRARELKLKTDRGVEITMVDQDGPAGKAGLDENDVVVSFNGQAIQSADQLRKLIRDSKPGTAISLGIVRDGQPQTIQATLANRAKMYSYAESGPMHVEIPSIKVRIPDIEIPSFVMATSSRRSGLSVENLTPQLGEFLGARNGEGVLVRSVDKGSKADAAGLRAGDVIVRVDNDRVSGASDWGRLLRHHSGGTVKLGIIRDRKEQSVSMTLPELSSENSFYVPGPDMDQLRMQLDRMGPEMGQQQAEIQARIAREMVAHQKEIQQAMRDAQREIERSMRDMQRDKDDALRDAEREKEHALRDAQREKERALRDAQREKEKEKAKQKPDDEE